MHPFQHHYSDDPFPTLNWTDNPPYSTGYDMDVVGSPHGQSGREMGEPLPVTGEGPSPSSQPNPTTNFSQQWTSPNTPHFENGTGQMSSAPPYQHEVRENAGQTMSENNVPGPLGGPYAYMNPTRQSQFSSNTGSAFSNLPIETCEFDVALPDLDRNSAVGSYLADTSGATLPLGLPDRQHPEVIYTLDFSSSEPLPSSQDSGAGPSQLPASHTTDDLTSSWSGSGSQSHKFTCPECASTFTQEKYLK